MIYKVYVRVNDQRRIISVASSGFLSELNGWCQIDEGSGDHYLHAQVHYFDKPIMDERGVYRYALDENDQPYELTQEEMDADYIEPVHELSDKERIKALEEQNAVLTEQNDMLTACVLEMSEILYA